ncbi:MAG: hypothetical protein IJL02_09700 [Methanobrevibacter sp.]|uniref:hypothetical protein n=1 Tax=Methanobrevibacter sp. TaxID=66852 RepID=UPI0025D1F6AF|nr:hypothetical protein [Methanobrevibacter sp.]MBQ6100114.1 hypothetical protein [Methanobrevibacter sp.]
MNYFLDSNVIVGHIFSWDSLNATSNDFIAYKNNYFYYKNVKNEVNNVFNEKCHEYDFFLLMLCRFFDNFSDNNFVDYEKVHRYLNGINSMDKFDKEDMHYALSVIWDRLCFDQYHDAFDVKTKFAIFQKDFQAIHIENKKKTFDFLKIVPNHTKKDKIILDKIKQENLRSNLLHGADEEILFDANEFCKNNPDLNLKFVSADQDFLKAIDILMDFLCIDESINLVEFSNN